MPTSPSVPTTAGSSVTRPPISSLAVPAYRVPGQGGAAGAGAAFWATGDAELMGLLLERVGCGGPPGRKFSSRPLKIVLRPFFPRANAAASYGPAAGDDAQASSRACRRSAVLDTSMRNSRSDTQ